MTFNNLKSQKILIKTYGRPNKKQLGLRMTWDLDNL